MAQQTAFLPTIKDKFFDDIAYLYEKSQPWDLVVFTGDLTQKGDAEEFKKLDGFLEELWKKFDQLGVKPQPSLVAVPGNHDLVRLKDEEDDPYIKLLTDTWERNKKMRDIFWSEPESKYSQSITAAFQNYLDWWERTQFKLPITQHGWLPGDFSAVFEKDGASLGIIGLNSTFLQLTAGVKPGALAIHPRQLQDVCDGDGPVWLKKHNANLLLTHQPPDWLNEESQRYLEQEIVGNNNFAVHLFGHMHEVDYRSQSQRGASRIRVFQTTSLYGLAEYGEEGKKIDRRHGFTVGRIELKGDEGALSFWPRTAYGSNQWNFAVDVAVTVKGEETVPEIFKLKKPFEPAPKPGLSNENQPATVFQKRWAVLIGINDYEHFAKLQYCKQDVIDLAQKLREDLKFDEVMAIYEEGKVRPDDAAIFVNLNRLRTANKIGADDLLLFYFAGHGINEGGKDYLLPISAHPNLVKRLGISIQDMIDELKKFNCKHTVMFIDACRETVAGARGVGSTTENNKAIGADTETLVKKANIATFFSCGPSDRSYEIDALGHGSFTYCILEAIKEGQVSTVADLERYLTINVPHTNMMNDKPPQLPKTVAVPETIKTWPIFRKPSGPLGLYGPYGPLVEKLNQLAAGDETFVGDILPGTLEFLGRIADTLELNAKEQLKLSAIKALCADELSLDEFSDTWQAMHRKRIPSPQIKKPNRLEKYLNEGG
jgi:predicted MPP superfamily phosphohydrolase